MTVGSICSGIEAATVALEPLGYKFSYYSEIAPFQARLLKEKYKDVQNVGDMTTIKDKILSKELPYVDMICGGTPCQAFSVSGYRRGLNDERGNLTLEFVKIIDANDKVREEHNLGKTICLWENVVGVLSDKTNAFGCLLSGLSGEEVTEYKSKGFIQGRKRNVAWIVYDTKDFGLPQQRKRVFVLAGGKEITKDLLQEVKPLSYSDTYSFTKNNISYHIFRNYTDCLYASYGTKWNGNAASSNGSLFVVQDDRLRRFTPLECERLMGFPDNYTKYSFSSNTSRYKALGNSWSIPVIEYIGSKLIGKEYKIKQKDLKDIVIDCKEENLYLSERAKKGILRRNKAINTNLKKYLL